MLRLYRPRHRLYRPRHRLSTDLATVSLPTSPPSLPTPSLLREGGPVVAGLGGFELIKENYDTIS